MPRPRSTDLNSPIRALVAEEVGRALGPYRTLLDRLGALVGVRRGPGRPPGSGTHAASNHRGRPRRVAGPVRKWAAGAKVRYKQGRGAFIAEVVRQDESGTVTVRRVEDGKEVQREPATLRKV
jgi:hypothetical protein